MVILSSNLTVLAHPRAGGENSCVAVAAMEGIGSSPRGRGKLMSYPSMLKDRRLIPARAGKTDGDRGGHPGWPAHPRAGGENPSTASAFPSCPGSSPRGRGKLQVGDAGGAGGGLIPARAGKTWLQRLRGGVGSAHPRAGGENVEAGGGHWSWSGSSPRGRGKRRGIPARAGGRRLIPARAGKTLSQPLRARRRTAHPRAGGENAAHALAEIYARGSSPRGRGKLDHLGGGCGVVGLIPARAGKTPRRPSARPRAPAHPRAGGENWLAGEEWALEAGSSPRGRGKQCRCRAWSFLPRLIPARAGKTSTEASCWRGTTAHPRAFGEHAGRDRAEDDSSGSSPRGRGKRPAKHFTGAIFGLIPARAGKTLSASSWTGRWQAHPRAGGENTSSARRGPRSGGSSPRGRGKLRLRRHVQEHRRLIPARAGKTRVRNGTDPFREAHPRAGGENTF